MPVKYIDVNPVSDLFAPAVRAFGDIAIVGKGGFGTQAADPQECVSPADAATKLLGIGGTTLTADAAAAATTVITKDIVPGDISVRLSKPDTSGTNKPDISEVHKVNSVAQTPNSSPPTYTVTLDGHLGVAYPTSSKVTQDSDNDLLRAVRTAFQQTPPPTTVWAVLVDSASPQWQAALDKVGVLDVQIVLFANTPLNNDNLTALGLLSGHVKPPFGDGKERIGVAMLAKADTAITEDVLKSLVGGVLNERMVLIAHKSDDDVAAAMAGVIAGHEPQISLLLKPIGIRMSTLFSDAEIDLYDRYRVNWVTSPVLLPGHSLYLGEGYTSDPSHDKPYIDIVRTLDDINFRIKAALIEAVGNLRISRAGLGAVEGIVQSVLLPLQAREVIEGFTVLIPLLTLLDKDEKDRSKAENDQIANARNARSVDMTIEVVYAGAIHRMKIDLVFTS